VLVAIRIKILRCPIHPLDHFGSDRVDFQIFTLIYTDVKVKIYALLHILQSKDSDHFGSESVAIAAQWQDPAIVFKWPDLIYTAQIQLIERVFFIFYLVGPTVIDPMVGACHHKQWQRIKIPLTTLFIQTQYTY
jgi:hypothetical protein